MKIHFIGIGGVGVNALAKFVADLGAETSGSDASLGALARGIRGARVYDGVDESVASSADVVVYTEAIKPSHVELVAARERGIPVFSRQEFLGAVSKLFGATVAVAGTHGKTTTTAMTAHILHAANKNFVGMIGGESVEFSNYVNNVLMDGLRQNGNAALRALFGQKCGPVFCDSLFLTEACEYKRSFLQLRPKVGACLNAERDHPDCYKDMEDIKDAFSQFLSSSDVSIAPADLFGEQKEEFEIVARGSGYQKRYALRVVDECRAKAYAQGEEVGDITLRDGGVYNLKNALFALAICDALSIQVDISLAALKDFEGVKRRFERVGEVGGAQVFFDFAHHPTEIACVLERAAKMGRVLAVFQPHTYSRTKAYFDDFVSVLSSDKAATVILLPTYAAREDIKCGVDSDALYASIAAVKGKNALMSNLKSAPSLVAELAPKHDVVLFIGAGDIYSLKDEMSKIVVDKN